MKKQSLRNYQIEMKAQIHAAWNGGMRSVMCQMPTGTGKTVVAVSVIRDELCPDENRKIAEDKTVLVVAHRREILEQTKETLRRHGLGKKLKDGAIVVESIQKLARMIPPEEITEGRDADEATTKLSGEKTAFHPSLVVIDEAHHATAETYRDLWNRWPEAKFLGLTATPCRLKKEGFTELFDNLFCSWPVKSFIKEGWLADFEYIVVKADSEMRGRINGLTKRGVDGDYQIKEMGGVLDNRASIEQLYRSYDMYARGKQGIVYAINREHAAHIAEYYQERIAGHEAGSSPKVALIDSGTGKKERKQLLEDYRDGKIQILVNCEIYTEGYDAPFVEFIQMARPTLSLSKYLQQVGRGLRPNKGGMKTVILDNVGLYYMFGLPSADRDWRKMFRSGQDVCQASKPSNMATLPLKVSNDLLAAAYMSDGHDCEMVSIDMETQERLDSGKAIIEEYHKKDINVCYRLKHNGKYVTEPFGTCSGYVDGVVCFEQFKYFNGDKHYYDEDGNLVAVFSGKSQLLSNAIIKAENRYEETGYYDVRMCEWLPCLPNIYNIDAASFVEEVDGWHIRSERFNYIAFEKENIHVITTNDGQRLVTMKDSKTGISYVYLPRRRNVMAFLGTEDDGTLVLANGTDRNIIFTWESERLIPHRKFGNERELYARWEEQMTAVPLDHKSLHLAIGTDYHIQTFINTDNNLLGWYLNNQMLCEAKFTEIVKFVDGKYVLAKLPWRDKVVVADYHGIILYDKQSVCRIVDDWAYVQDASGKSGWSRYNLVTGGFVE